LGLRKDNDYISCISWHLRVRCSATMAARPPPARPHIGISPSFHSPHSADWAEDDAWDSTSDSESPRQSTINNSWMQSSSRPPSSATNPKPVPKPSVSSSTLAFSYTHINAPSPSSYPPKPEQPVQQKSGWTIVRKSTEIRVSAEEKEEAKVEEGVDDADDESEMVVGELEQEGTVESTVKPSQDQVFIRDDVDEILNGSLLSLPWFLIQKPIHVQIHFMVYDIDRSNGATSLLDEINPQTFL